MSGAIVFDLDGTLVDSAADLHAAGNRMLAEFGFDPLTLAQVKSFIGHGIPNLVTRMMQAQGAPEADHAAMTKAMLRHYSAHPADLTRPYPGVIDTLRALHAAGHPLGLCTNKNHAPTLQILDALDMARFFDVVIGGDSLPLRKPDPAPLRMAFAALDAAPLVYVGDSEVDSEAAQRAALPFALFTQGYRKGPVAAHLSFDDWARLPALLDQLSCDGQSQMSRI